MPHLRKNVVLGVLLILSMYAETLSAQGTVSAWDVFLACRAVTADTAKGVLQRKLCREATLPRLRRDFEEVELERWRALSVLDPSAVRVLKDIAVRQMIDRIPGTVGLEGEVFRFEPEKHRLTEFDLRRLEVLARRIRERQEAEPNWILEIVGSADSTGNPADNQRLAENRALAIRNALVASGARAEQLRVTAAPQLRGEHNITRAQRENNRSVTLVGTAPSVNLLPRPAPAPTIQGMGTAAIVAGLSDFLVAKAIENLEDFLLDETGKKLCLDSRALILLPQTCQLWKRLDGTYRLGHGTFRTAIQQDLTDLPVVVVSDLFQVAQNQPAKQSLALLRALASGEAPLIALANLSTEVEEDLAVAMNQCRLASASEFIPRCKENPDVAALSHLSSITSSSAKLGHVLNDFQLPLDRTMADTAVLYLLRAEAVGGRFEQALTELPRYSALAHAAADARFALDSLRVLQRGGQRDSTLVVHRAAMIEQMLDAGTRMLLAGAGGPESPDVTVIKNMIPHLRGLMGAWYGRDLNEAMVHVIRVTASICPVSTAVTDDGPSYCNNRPDLAVLTFVADLSAASSSEDVRNAMFRYTQSGAGYRGKRSAKGAYAALNSYPGGSAGWGQGGLAFAASLPLGLEFKLKPGWPRIFLQALNLGEVAAARFGGSETSVVRWENLVAPGGFTILGLGNTPLVLSTGISVLPAGRTEADGSTHAAVRIQAALGVDVTIMRW